ncbi:argininosuccinate lyase [Aquibacillus salsiterrae]|uniref:Argininosuccinate lyase n=1 Tax=Aquibacillus salsiterrae TaxID=2950439 RepID=A0A9X3WET3_9BACI|nr:argininosuccinate lyase [Aquibacillus salsiterrae]MDC3418467.1 argininosuccinate lyase [Aquibacillus salsiterrae]
MVRSDTYIKTILQPTYDFTNEFYFPYIVEVNIAHIIMLTEQNLLKVEEAVPIVDYLQKLHTKPTFKQAYNSQYEDLFFMIEAELEEKFGKKIVGDIHIAFSRNDMDATMFRMCWRKQVNTVMKRITRLQSVILALVEKHKDTVMPAYTHNQQAQPTTLAHYLLAINAHLARDIQRGRDLYQKINLSPMGAAALGTTGFPIDRGRMAELLGFNGIIENSYDAIAANDYMLEAASFLSISLSTLSRVVYDLLFLATNETNGILLDEQHVQTSSIMPQKRNPSALEHCRAQISRAIGGLQGITYMSHSVPFGDIVDIGDDIQPILAEGFENSVTIYDLLTEIIACMQVNKEILYERCANGFSTVTELADLLVRNYQLPFRTAHQVVSSFVTQLTKEKQTLADGNAAMVNQVAKKLNVPLNLTDEDFKLAIDPNQFVQVRSVTGGPSKSEVSRQHQKACKSVNEVHRFINQVDKQLQRYPEKLKLH